MPDVEKMDLSELEANIEDELARRPTLTDQQVEDLKVLRVKLRELWTSGNLEEATRCYRQALLVCHEGGPEPE